MSIKTKAKEMVTKGKKFFAEHQRAIKYVGVAMMAVGAYGLGVSRGENYTINCIQVGWDHLEAAKVLGFGAIKDGQFVQVTQKEALELVKVYSATL